MNSKPVFVFLETCRVTELQKLHEHPPFCTLSCLSLPSTHDHTQTFVGGEGLAQKGCSLLMCACTGSHRSCGTRIGIKKLHRPPIFLFPLEFEASPAVHLTKIALDRLRAPFCLTLGTGDSLAVGRTLEGPMSWGCPDSHGNL